jgi:hypothetical protein
MIKRKETGIDKRPMAKGFGTFNDTFSSLRKS